MRLLSKRQRHLLMNEYQSKGYVVLKNFFEQHEMLDFTAWTQEIIDWPIVHGKWLKYYETLDNSQESVLSRIEHFVTYHAGFKQVAHDTVLLALLSDLMGKRVLFFKEKLNVKMGGARGYTPHQDAPAFFDIDYDAISIFIPIDAATIENGCLYFVKDGESFKEEMLRQNQHNHALCKEVVDAFHWIPLECQPRDVIIFSAYAPHYSTKNMTSSPRRALFMSFGRKEHSLGKTTLYYDKKRKIFPQDSEKKSDVDYTDAAAIYSFSSPVDVNKKKDA